MKHRVVFSLSRNVYLNLAYEEYLLSSAQEEVLFIYINEPSVVIGRFQNPWAESFPCCLKKKGINLARRLSGGGAVYHDSGNLNLCLVSSSTSDRMFLARFISDVLLYLGIDTVIDERSAIFLPDKKKISGAAFKISGGKMLLHNTLLVSSDPASVSLALSPSPGVFESRAVSSVRADVACLSDYADVSVDILARLMADRWGSFSEYLAEDDMIRLCGERAGFFSSDDWVFGRTPDFLWRYGELAVRVESGRVRAVCPPVQFSSFVDRIFDPCDFMLNSDLKDYNI